MSKEKQYASILRPILDGLALHPSRISVREFRDGQRVDLFVKCHIDDVGFIVGKEGRTFKATQELFRNIGRVNGDTIGLALAQEGNSQREREVVPKFSDRSWDKSPAIISIFVACVEALGYDIAVDAEEFHDKTLLNVRSSISNELTKPLDWILKMIACHSGRKLTFNWK